MLCIIFSYFDVVVGPKLLSYYPENPKLKQEYLSALLTMFDVNFIEHPFNFKIEDKCFLNYIVEVSEPESRSRYDSYMVSILIEDEEVFNEVRYITITYLQEFLDKYKKKYWLVRDVRKYLENKRTDFETIEGAEEFFQDLNKLYSRIQKQMKIIEEEEIISTLYFNIVANVFEINPLPILVLNHQNEIIFGNNASEELFGYNSEEMQGKSILEYFQEKDHEIITESLKKIKMEHSLTNINGAIITKNGNNLTVSIDLNYLGGGLGVSTIIKKKKQVSPKHFIKY